MGLLHPSSFPLLRSRLILLTVILILSAFACTADANTSLPPQLTIGKSTSDGKEKDYYSFNKTILV